VCWEAMKLALSGCRKGCMEQEVVELGAWRSEVVGAFVLVEFENRLRAGERLEPCA
jgi:hypothetical protein